MKCAADFRAEARAALRGRWPIAILTGFVASLIGAGIATGGGSSGNSNSNSDSTRMLIDEFTATEFWLQFRAVIIGLIVALVIFFIVRQKKKGKVCIGCPYAEGCTKRSCQK